LLHIDMYNIKTYEELLHKWILDLIDQYQLIVIEWPKFVEQLDLEDPTTIFITKKDSSTRELSIMRI
jgi:tRNA A37 threonylcarbamoyladenosine biosynthesis protein TsaE